MAQFPVLNVCARTARARAVILHTHSDILAMSLSVDYFCSHALLFWWLEILHNVLLAPSIVSLQRNEAKMWLFINNNIFRLGRSIVQKYHTLSKALESNIADSILKSDHIQNNFPKIDAATFK